MNGLIKPPLGAEIDWVHPLAQGLVCCLVMNEGAGRHLTDLVQRSTPALGGGSTADPGWRSGPFGWAAQFDGSNDYFTLGTPAALDLRGPMSIVARVCRTGTASAMQVCSKGFESNTTQYQLYYQDNDGFSRTNRMRFGTYNGSHQEVVSNSEVPLNTWQTWISSFTGSEYRISLNGVLDAASANTTAPAATTRNVLIGAIDAPAAGGNIQFWNGPIDLLYIYGRSLSLPENAWLAREPFAMLKAGVRRFYSLPAATTLFRRSLFDRAGSRGVARI